MTKEVKSTGRPLVSADSPTFVPAAVSANVLPQTRGQKLLLVGLVILKRIRFIAVLAGVGLFIGYWDTVLNYWEKWTQPQRMAARELQPGREFYCPMDPQVVRSTYEPNGDVPKCPICGMPLSVRKKGEIVKLPEGITGRVQLSPERVQLAGIKTVMVDYRPVAKQTKTVGYITFDESKLSRIVSRVDGYVEKLYVTETYTVVHQGDPLAEIYSPELFSTARELLLATKAGGMGDLAAAARSKLQLLGVSDQEIDALVKAGTPSARLVIRSPQSGYVVEKKIVVGSSVDAKMTLLEVADLSTVWIEADVYEKDIPFLQVGQTINATVEAYPHKTFTGKLARIYPRLESATRTNRIRLKLDNTDQELRPGMFANVRIETPLENIEPYKTLALHGGRTVPVVAGDSERPAPVEFLTVPERAVIDTGAKKVVYVEREPGLFEGVVVELGPRHEDVFPVLKGLKPGDKVAAAGGFLIDAETRLNPAAAATYFGASGGPQTSNRATQPTPVVNKSETPAPAKGADPPTTKQETPPPKLTAANFKFNAEQLENLQQLPEADRKLALTQRICPITDEPLGSMGVPIKVVLRDKPVFLCCKGCLGKAKRNPDEVFKKLADFAASAGTSETKPK